VVVPGVEEGAPQVDVRIQAAMSVRPWRMRPSATGL
jgi:hypothetical protein